MFETCVKVKFETGVKVKFEICVKVKFETGVKVKFETNFNFNYIVAVSFISEGNWRKKPQTIKIHFNIICMW